VHLASHGKGNGAIIDRSIFLAENGRKDQAKKKRQDQNSRPKADG
jgi:hypothetical protein